MDEHFKKREESMLKGWKKNPKNNGKFPFGKNGS